MSSYQLNVAWKLNFVPALVAARCLIVEAMEDQAGEAEPSAMSSHRGSVASESSGDGAEVDARLAAFKHRLAHRANTDPAAAKAKAQRRQRHRRASIPLSVVSEEGGDGSGGGEGDGGSASPDDAGGDTPGVDVLVVHAQPDDDPTGAGHIADRTRSQLEGDVALPASPQRAQARRSFETRFGSVSVEQPLTTTQGDAAPPTSEDQDPRASSDANGDANGDGGGDDETGGRVETEEELRARLYGSPPPGWEAPPPLRGSPVVGTGGGGGGGDRGDSGDDDAASVYSDVSTRHNASSVFSTASDTKYDRHLRAKLAEAGELFVAPRATASVMVQPDTDADDVGAGPAADADVMVLRGGRKGRRQRRRVEVRKNVRGDALVSEVRDVIERAMRADVDDCDQCNACQHDCIHVGNSVLLYVAVCLLHTWSRRGLWRGGLHTHSACGCVLHVWPPAVLTACAFSSMPGHVRGTTQRNTTRRCDGHQAVAPTETVPYGTAHVNSNSSRRLRQRGKAGRRGFRLLVGVGVP